VIFMFPRPVLRTLKELARHLLGQQGALSHQQPGQIVRHQGGPKQRRSCTLDLASYMSSMGSA
jgi:hypothetical protein